MSIDSDDTFNGLNTTVSYGNPPSGGLLNLNVLNKNFLSPLNFAFSIKKCPTVNFFCQKVNIPGVTLGNGEQPRMATPFVDIPETGDHIHYDPLNIEFRVDENLINFLEIYTWIKDLGFPKKFDEYKKLADVPQWTGKGVRSDITVIVMNNEKNPNYEINFIDAFPFSLSEAEFDVTKQDINYLVAKARFRYTYFDIKKIK